MGPLSGVAVSRHWSSSSLADAADRFAVAVVVAAAAAAVDAAAVDAAAVVVVAVVVAAVRLVSVLQSVVFGQFSSLVVAVVVVVAIADVAND